MSNPDEFSEYPRIREEDFDSVEGPRMGILREASRRLKMSIDEVDVFYRHKFEDEQIPKDFASRRAMLDYLRKKDERPPLWMQVSGLYPEMGPDPRRRRERVRALMKATTLLIRRELAANENEQADPNVSAEIKGERSVFWDPVGPVCAWLGIAQSKLSAYCKELTGSNLVQTIDSVKAEGLKGKMRKEVREFVVGLRKGTEGTQGTEGAAPSATFVTEDGDVEVFDKWFVWKALKASRKAPEFCLNSWAQGFGFANYRRMYRACQVVYRKTPYQMIMELIEEALEAEETAGRMPALPVSEFKEWSLEELETALREIRGYPMLR